MDIKILTSEDLGLDVDSPGIYAISEVTWVKSMIAEYHETGSGRLQFGVGDAPKGTMRNRLKSLSSSKNLEEQKFFIDAIPNPGYRDHPLHSIIVEKFAYQVSQKKKEVFKVKVPNELIMEFINSNYDFEPIRQWLSHNLRQCASKLNQNHAKQKVNYRNIQKTIIDEIIEVVKQKKFGTVVIEAAPRTGKTLAFLGAATELQKMHLYKGMFILGYGVGLGIKNSYFDEIGKFIDFDRFTFIDNSEDTAECQYKETIGSNKFPIVFVSLNATEKLNWLEKLSGPWISLSEEADFGVHTNKQTQKKKLIFKNKDIFEINASGTNIGRIGKASGQRTIDKIIRVPYYMVEQDASIPNVVSRNFYHSTFDPKLSKLLKNFGSPDYNPTMKKVLEKSDEQELFLSTLFQDMLGYQPIYGLSLNNAANDMIDHFMLRTSISKVGAKRLKDLIEKYCNRHWVLILNGDNTSNREAQSKTNEALVALKNGKYPGRDKLIVMTNMMGTRSYSIPDIQAVVHMNDGGSIYPFSQASARCLTPGQNKEYGHIFEFGFDHSKNRMCEMVVADEAVTSMEREQKSFPDSIRQVMKCINIRDLMTGKWTDANDIIDNFENSDKLVEVANSISRVSVEDFTSNDMKYLIELANMKSNEKKKFEAAINLGKTYQRKSHQTGLSLDEETKVRNNRQKLEILIKRAIQMLNSSASTVVKLSNYTGETYIECLNIIEQNENLRTEFLELFNVNIDFVIRIKEKLPLAILDMIVARTINGNDSNNLMNKTIGIMSDPPEMWRDIFIDGDFLTHVKNCQMFGVAAGGNGTEIDVAIELLGIDIIEKIMYNDKHIYNCNFIKHKYPDITIREGDFLKTKMNVDAIVGNPPYNKGDAGNTPIWPEFLYACEHVEHQAWVIPSAWLISPGYSEIRRYIIGFGLKWLKVNKATMFEDARVKTVSIILQKGYASQTTIVDDYESYQIQLDPNEPIVFGGSEIGTNLIRRVQTDTKFKMTNNGKKVKKAKSYAEATSNTTIPIFTKLCKNNEFHVKEINASEDAFDLNFNKDRIVIGCLPSGVEKGAAALGAISVLPKNTALLPGYYRYYVTNSKKEADALRSYLISDLITFLQLKSRTSPSLDNPQLLWIPFWIPKKVVTNADVYAYFNISESEIAHIERTIDEQNRT